MRIDYERVPRSELHHSKVGQRPYSSDTLCSMSASSLKFSTSYVQNWCSDYTPARSLLAPWQSCPSTAAGCVGSHAPRSCSYLARYWLELVLLPSCEGGVKSGAIVPICGERPAVSIPAAGIIAITKKIAVVLSCPFFSPSKGAAEYCLSLLPKQTTRRYSGLSICAIHWYTSVPE